MKDLSIGGLGLSIWWIWIFAHLVIHVTKMGPKKGVSYRIDSSTGHFRNLNQKWFKKSWWKFPHQICGFPHRIPQLLDYSVNAKLAYFNSFFVAKYPLYLNSYKRSSPGGIIADFGYVILHKITLFLMSYSLVLDFIPGFPIYWANFTWLK